MVIKTTCYWMNLTGIMLSEGGEVKWSEVAQSCSTLCNPRDTRLLRPWDFLGKSTGVGCHFLLQGIFLTQGLIPGLPHCRQTLYRLSHQGSPSVSEGSCVQRAISIWFHVILDPSLEKINTRDREQITCTKTRGRERRLTTNGTGGLGVWWNSPMLLLTICFCPNLQNDTLKRVIIFFSN